MKFLMTRVRNCGADMWATGLIKQAKHSTTTLLRLPQLQERSSPSHFQVHGFFVPTCDYGTPTLRRHRI